MLPAGGNLMHGPCRSGRSQARTSGQDKHHRVALPKSRVPGHQLWVSWCPGLEGLCQAPSSVRTKK